MNHRFAVEESILVEQGELSGKRRRCQLPASFHIVLGNPATGCLERGLVLGDLDSQLAASLSQVRTVELGKDLTPGDFCALGQDAQELACLFYLADDPMQVSGLNRSFRADFPGGQGRRPLGTRTGRKRLGGKGTPRERGNRYTREHHQQQRDSE